MIKNLAALIGLALLSACGGGGGGGTGGGVPSAAGGTALGAAHSNVAFTLLVAAPPTSTTAERRVLDVPFYTTSVVINVTQVNDVQPNPPLQYTVDLTACPRHSASAARSPQAARKPLTAGTAPCTFSISAPIGADTFSLATYDAAAHPISIGTASTTVVANTANSVTTTLHGVIKTITMAIENHTPLASGTPTTHALTYDAVDAHGFVIAVDDFATPITITDVDPTGATTMSTSSDPTLRTTIVVPHLNVDVTVHYSGAAGVTATFTAATGGITPASATATLVSHLPPN
jgi:hypothetical protein